MKEDDLKGNEEIEEALKEFEVKNPTQTVQASAAASIGSSDGSKMAQLIIKYSGGYIKDERQAEYVLLGFAIVVIIFSLFLLFGSSSTSSTTDIKILPAV